MRAWILALLLLAACDEFAIPIYVAPPPPPGDAIAASNIKIAEGTAGGILFDHFDRARPDGNGSYFDDIRVRDASILRVVQSTRNASIDFNEGHAFAIVGLRAGETDVDVHSGTAVIETIHVTVVPQD